MARRSARISSRNSSTPQPTKRVSLSHDPFIHAPRTVPAKLTSLQEIDEMPGSFPISPSTSVLEQPSKRRRALLGTPTRDSSMVPAREEMHPQAAHQSTAKVNEEARWLGFSAMPSHAEITAKEARTSLGTSTPTKNQPSEIMVHTPSAFEFTFRREQSLGLSPAAKALMQEKSAEAAQIKEQMKRSGEVMESLAEAWSRRIATPKSQRNRFSDVHSAQFQKMDSIAGHASAYRKDPQRLQTLASPFLKATPGSAAAQLKRSPSKPSLVSTPSKIAQAVTTTGLKRKADAQLTKAASEKAQSGSDFESASPRKRIKCVESTAQPNTPTPAKLYQQSVHTTFAPNIEHITTPTKSSLARASSMKSANSSKIPAPTVPSTPSKTASVSARLGEKKTSSLLSETPVKATVGLSEISAVAPSSSKSPLLTRSPVRPHATSVLPSATIAPETTQGLLSYAALKASLSTSQSTAQAESLTRTPLLSQSPSRTTIDKNPFKTETPLQNANKSVSSNLLERFNGLRATPVKSILRSPKRLYSDDPAKVAAGTHLATPPQVKSRFGRKIPATAPVRKHVDFSSSTKAREASKEASMSPLTFVSQPQVAPISGDNNNAVGIVAYPSLDEIEQDEPLSVQKRRQSSGPGDFTFRADSEIVFAPSSTPTKTAITPRAASAYTIRYVAPEPEISVPTTIVNATKQRKIRFENAVSVAQTNASPTMTLGSKKRKFDFENDVAEKDAGLGDMLDKENMSADGMGDNTRPTKRLKAGTSPKGPILASQNGCSATAVKKRTTLGVKPLSAVGRSPGKLQKKPGNTISMARLAALSQPKKRG